MRAEASKVGELQWNLFCVLVGSKVGSGLLDFVWTCPCLMGVALAQFGEHVYECGECIDKIRQLVI